MNISTLVILAVLAAIVIVILRGMIRDKKAGKSCHGCSGSCGGCNLGSDEKDLLNK